MEQCLPFVTAMIVVRNEEKYIGKAVTSFLGQDYPADRMELLLIDGQSDDRTLENAKKAAEEFACAYRRDVAVRYLENPKRLLAAGWNLGIQEARGEYVVRIDAHAQADAQLIRKCVQVLDEKPDVACAGGRIEAQPLTEKGRLISAVLSSPFGVGNARFRYAEESGYVDTVAYGVYRKSIFDAAGYFNETFVRNQDNDMHGRIKKCGGKFYLEASVKSIYHSRETVKGMMKQGYGNGKWNIVVCKRSESKEGLSLRHLIPLLFVLANLVLILAGGLFCFFRWVFLGMYVLYFGLAGIFSAKKARSPADFFKMCAYYWLLHISYGAGSLVELFHL